MHSFRRLLASLACIVVGVASFALSYVALRDEAIRVGAVPEYLGWLVPVVLDGGVICGSAVIWSYSKEAAKRPLFPFAFVGLLVLVSVVVNISHAGDPLLAKAIAALPPLILLGTLELVAAQGRRDLEEDGETVVQEVKGVEPRVATTPVITAQSSLGGVAGSGSVHVLTIPEQRQEARAEKPARTRSEETKPRARKPVRKAAEVPVQAPAPTETPSGAPTVEDVESIERQIEEAVGGIDLRPRRAATRKPLRVSAEEPDPLPA